MPHRSPASRRQFLRRAAAALAAAPLARPALAQTKLRDVTLRLDWVFQGPNAGFMMAHEKGFYKGAAARLVWVGGWVVVRKFAVEVRRATACGG